MPLTDEQERIASSRAKTLVVNAYAGTGKTSVLVEYARRRPETRMIYLAFNRSIKEEASRRFPPNVRCVTTHGLAFPKFGAMYQHKFGNLKASHIARLLDVDFIGAGHVLATITNYLASPELRLGEAHAIPTAPKASRRVIGEIVHRAERVWEAMQDTDCREVPMPHDGYLKLYQCSIPVIRTDRILFDEAQDANPVTVDFVTRQDCGKTIVGDRHQSIYQFRGAIDALGSIQADDYLDLTASFRFGGGIAELASGMLMDWCGASKPVRGLGKRETVFAVDPGLPHAVIARTNGCLFAEAVAQVVGNRKFGFAGGVEGYRFDQILDAYYLLVDQRHRIRDQYIASFDDFMMMKGYGEELDDKEIKVLVKVVEDYRHDIPGLIEEIKRRAIANLAEADVTLATAHKSKGLEFENVILTDDYTELLPKREPETGKEIPPKAEEVHVLYVALTRAQVGLEVPVTVREWLAESGRQHLLDQISNATARRPFKTSPAKAPPVPEMIHAVEASIATLLEHAKGDRKVASLLAEFLRSKANKIEGKEA